jgi:homocysteine S-methyltransferase
MGAAGMVGGGGYGGAGIAGGKTGIRGHLSSGRALLCDGAFGTYYDTLQRGADYPVELANIKNSALVRQIHAEYIESGAGMIRTNTFGANAPNLRCGREALREIIADGLEIARSAAGSDAFVAASIGPVRHPDAEAATLEYRLIAEEFIAAGATMLLFESMDDYGAVLPALAGIRQALALASAGRNDGSGGHGRSDSGQNRANSGHGRNDGGGGQDRANSGQDYADSGHGCAGSDNGGLFIALSFCVNRYGYTDSGLSAKRIVRELSARGEIDCIGFNCGTGPLHLYKALSGIGLGGQKPSIVLPNAGYPDSAGNRYLHQNNIGYFTEWLCRIRGLGIDIIGGCCGTTPQYTKAIRDAMERAPADWAAAPRAVPAAALPADLPATAAAPAQGGRAPAPAGRVPPFFEAAAKARGKIIAAELDPPMTANYTKIMEDAIRLKNMGVDILTFADSPTGRARADSFLIASKVLGETGVAVMPHICCRDKNEIAVRAQILGAHINGIRSVLAVTGDPAPHAAHGSSRGVFSFDSVRLMGLINTMNEDLFAGDPVYFGGAINQSRRNIGAETERLKRKIGAGASWFLTQPVYGDEDIDALLSMKERTGATILCGLMPLISLKNAMFVVNELPGIRVPDGVISQYSEGMGRAEGEETGIRIARGIAARTSSLLDGYYFVLPFNRTHLVSRILA